MEMWAVVLGIWIACGLLAAAVRRNRADGTDWFATGVVLGPVGLLMAVLPGPTNEEPRPTCVHCGKVVGRGRKQLCNHCGEPFAA